MPDVEDTVLQDKAASLMRGRGVKGLMASLLLAVMFAVLVAGPALVRAATTYKVQPGDTLTGIAQRYGVTIDAIVAANGLSSRTIYAGQSLSIPSASSQSAPAVLPAGGTYTVQPGDTLSGIALRFGTTTDALQRANGLGSTAIYAGQSLKIAGPDSAPPPQAQQPAQPPAQPQPQQPQANPGTYNVQPGDSLTAVAARFGMTREALAAANGISASSLLYIGQVLKIPGVGNTQSSPATQPAAPTPTSTPPPAPQPVASAVAGAGTLVPEPAPPMGQFGPKWVDVTLSTQTLIAYEGQTPVFTSKISSGVSGRVTVEGMYRVYAKYLSTRLRGGSGAGQYDYPDVPYTMYFYADYALNGAYWQNNFGQPASQGSVNLPVDASKWLFNWAPIGTLVVTHK